MPSKERLANRTGRFVTQPEGYRAFIPAPLPPDPPLDLDDELQALLAEAGLELGRLDGVVRVIPDPDFFVGMYVRREAVLSSQIEGTLSTLEDLLEVELEDDPKRRDTDVMDIVNYVHAMNSGLRRLDSLPLSLRLVREIHGDYCGTEEERMQPRGSSGDRRTGLAPPARL